MPPGVPVSSRLPAGRIRRPPRSTLMGQRRPSSPGIVSGAPPRDQLEQLAQAEGQLLEPGVLPQRVPVVIAAGAAAVRGRLRHGQHHAPQRGRVAREVRAGDDPRSARQIGRPRLRLRVAGAAVAQDRLARGDVVDHQVAEVGGGVDLGPADRGRCPGARRIRARARSRAARPVRRGRRPATTGAHAPVGTVGLGKTNGRAPPVSVAVAPEGQAESHDQSRAAARSGPRRCRRARAAGAAAPPVRASPRRRPPTPGVVPFELAFGHRRSRRRRRSPADPGRGRGARSGRGAAGASPRTDSSTRPIRGDPSRAEEAGDPGRGVHAFLREQIVGTDGPPRIVHREPPAAPPIDSAITPRGSRARRERNGRRTPRRR